MKKLLLLFNLLILSTTIGAQAQGYLIGIADTYNGRESTVMRTYIEAVQRSGNLPIILPLTENDSIIAQTLRRIDALILSGGEDIQPSLYGDRPSKELGTVNIPRDEWELRILKQAIPLHLPILGICRGMQMINVYFGGSLIQDLPTEYPQSSIGHNQRLPRTIATHDIEIVPNSFLERITGKQRLQVNSFHHQAVKRLAQGFQITAKAPDGVIEAIEAIHYPIVCVQFHPEGLAFGNDTIFTKIFEEFPKLISKSNKNHLNNIGRN